MVSTADYNTPVTCGPPDDASAAAGAERRRHEEVVPFRAGDGMELNLVHVRGSRSPGRGPVLLVHGAGVRANLFRPPVKRNLVDVLLEEDYDVWLENWRASIDLPPNPWTLDRAALHDHPAAVRTVVRKTGARSVKAIVHCQGATSFTMSAVAGLVPEVDVIVANAVTLHPVTPRWSRFKLRWVTPVARAITPHLDPHWGVRAPTLATKLITGLVRMSHHECRNTVCRMVSFIYGSGFPALWRHENLDGPTHEWLKEEFGPCPMSFFSQMDRCVRAGRLVSIDGLDGLPLDFTAAPPKTTARFALLAGDRSRCFLPESQVRTWAFLERHQPGRHSLHRFPEYSHLDVLIGQRAAEDVFPVILGELGRGPGPTG